MGKVELEECVVAFGFLSPADLNYRIESIVWAQQPRRVYTHRDLDEANLPEMDVTKIYEGDGGTTTLGFSYKAVEWAEEQGFKVIKIACAPPHEYRVIRDLEYILKETGSKIRLEVCPRIDDDSWRSWFNQKSVLWQTRSPLLWIPRETFLRLLRVFAFPLYKKMSLAKRPQKNS